MLFLRTFGFFFFFISYVPDDATAAVLYVLSWKGDRFFFSYLVLSFVYLILFLFRSK